MDVKPPLRLGQVGIGGYGRSVKEWVDQYADRVRIVAACDPALASLSEDVAALRRGGAAVMESFDQMLDDHADQLDMVWLCLPIHLHLAATLKALAAGVGVMCEKPVAGCVQEVDRMIEAQRESGLPVMIAFQEMFRPSVLRLKQRLVGGEWGRVQQVRVTGVWPRFDRYFQRNGWAGRLHVTVNGQRHWVLDSPLNNAMSHYAMLALFFAGSTVEDACTLTAVEAETYAAAAIENYDTVSLRCWTDSGTPILINLTHASEAILPVVVQVSCERGELFWSQQQGCRIEPHGGPVEPIELEAVHVGIMDAFINARSGKRETRGLLVTPEVARVHSLLASAVSESAPIVRVPEAHLRVVESDQGVVTAIPGIDQVFARAHEQGQTLSETGAYPFTRSPTRFDLGGYHAFRGPGACVASSG